MRFILIIFFALTGTLLSAQAPAGLAVLKLKKNQVLEAKSIKNFVFLPKGCKISSYLLTVKHGSNFKDFQCKGDAITKEVAAALKKVNPGESFFIEKIKASCKGVKQKYEVAVK
ncbi:MAG: GldM family protein [Bacteroidia bacterium]